MLPGQPDDRDIIEQIPAAGELERITSLNELKLTLCDVPVVMPDPDVTILANIYAQRRAQAKVAFWVAIPMGIAGTLLIFASTFVGSIKGGIGGGIIDALTFFMIRFNREVNRGLDDAVEHLNFNRRIDKLFEKAEQIADPRVRDKSIANLIDALAKPLKPPKASSLQELPGTSGPQEPRRRT